jgi:hypothetical protein
VVCRTGSTERVLVDCGFKHTPESLYKCQDTEARQCDAADSGDQTSDDKHNTRRGHGVRSEDLTESAYDEDDSYQKYRFLPRTGAQ